jgi:hypothetical protein
MANAFGFLRLPVFILTLVFSPVCAASTTDPNYSGHYELKDAKAARTFLLDVKLDGSRANVSFSAEMADGSGAAPDGSGNGHVEDGVLTFKLKDSFNNECACTLTAKSDGYHLGMTVIKAVEPSPLHFYGNMLLQKTSSHPQ